MPLLTYDDDIGEDAEDVDDIESDAERPVLERVRSLVQRAPISLAYLGKVKDKLNF